MLIIQFPTVFKSPLFVCYRMIQHLQSQLTDVSYSDPHCILIPTVFVCYRTIQHLQSQLTVTVCYSDVSLIKMCIFRSPLYSDPHCICLLQDDSTFTITVDGKTFHFQAQDSQERERWIRALEDTVVRHNQYRHRSLR